jgi:hypothetical protein
LNGKRKSKCISIETKLRAVKRLDEDENKKGPSGIGVG